MKELPRIKWYQVMPRWLVVRGFWLYVLTVEGRGMFHFMRAHKQYWSRRVWHRYLYIQVKRIRERN